MKAMISSQRTNFPDEMQISKNAFKEKEFYIILHDCFAS